MVNRENLDRRTFLGRGMTLAAGAACLGMKGGVFGATREPDARANANGSCSRWSAEKAKAWYEEQPWPVGCNFIPSCAINQIETWQAESFDAATMDRELGLAEGIGFNTVRVFLHDLVWEADPDGFKGRLGAFLDLCKKHRIRAIVTFFTNGCYGFEGEPRLGKQPDPVPGVHNSGWVQTPGAANVNDPSKWGRLEKYVKDVVGTFARDERVLLWCLYNEPENTKKGARSLPLMRNVFAWARAANPSQPLTAPMWTLPGGKRSSPDIVAFLTENCDVMSFHSYRKPKDVEALINYLKSFDRPILCTEYMARTAGSTFEAILPILKRERVGAINFGLVAGKGNFHFPWGSKKDAPEPKIWFHDIFRSDGTPYDPAEIALIRRLTGADR